MKIYDENQFTKSKLDERERGNSLGLEDSDETIIELTYSDVKSLVMLVLNYAEKHENDMDENTRGALRVKNKKIPTKYGYIKCFSIHNGMDHENEVEIAFDLVRKNKNVTYRPKNGKRVGSHYVSNEFKEGKYMHQFSTLDGGGPLDGQTAFILHNWPV